MRLIYIVLVGSLIGFAACNNTNGDKTAENAAPKEKAPTQSKLSSEGTSMLMDMMSKYYSVKNALVATKAPAVNTAAAELEKASIAFQSFMQKDSANYVVLRPYTDTVVAMTAKMVSITDPTCEQQRLAFEPISSALYGMLKAVDIKNAGTYHTYCPMAFNDKGAFWLSEESEIKNPYFGKKMLECGEVTDSL